MITPIITIPPIITEEMLDKIFRLSDCEFEVFQLCGQGLKLTTISRMPGRIKSISTVEGQMITATRKLELNNINELRMIATRFIVYKEQNCLVQKAVSALAKKPRRRELVKS